MKLIEVFLTSFQCNAKLGYKNSWVLKLILMLRSGNSIALQLDSTTYCFFLWIISQLLFLWVFHLQKIKQTRNVNEGKLKDMIPSTELLHVGLLSSAWKSCCRKHSVQWWLQSLLRLFDHRILTWFCCFSLTQLTAPFRSFRWPTFTQNSQVEEWEIKFRANRTKHFPRKT